MISLSPQKTKYDLLLIGTKVRCTKFIRFIDSTKHKSGEILEVTEETQAYYTIFTTIGDYEVV